MQCIQYFVYDLQRNLPRCTGLPGIGKGHGGAKGFAGKAAHRAQSSHAHGDDGSLRMPVGHFSGGSQKLQHVGATLRHHSQFGQIGTGPLHGNHAAHQLGARRRFMEVVAGTHHCSPGGAGPVIEVFRDRIEVTNPGTPLVDIDRIIDNPPRSRNEKLASLMRRLGLCEELGTGWDKIVIKCESEQLPAPLIQTFTDSTRVTLYANAPFASISSADKLRACYLHACIKQVQGEQMTNSSLRARFGLKDSSSGSISRLIKEAVNQGYIKPFDPETAPRYMRYIPIWA